ncbi:MAG: tRNA threonylcarbamoyladenosine dehydratase [Eubacterium sp.]|nr:tRNA threonylcarbamoyladenosine dehydratase [Eubacterium sp.]
MNNSFSRSIGLLGEEGMEKLKQSTVIIFGVGGVGSYAAEALARAGVGSITVVDNDVVDMTNINRQLIALHSTVGMDKVAVSKSRIEDINPLCKVTAIKEFFDENSSVDLTEFDYIIDCIDSVQSKLLLAEIAMKNNIKIISAMGTGNKLEPDQLKITDISKTSYCPLAKKMRVELRKRGINHLKVVYSTEEPKCRNVPPASVSFVPSVAGLMMAGEVIRDLVEIE